MKHCSKLAVLMVSVTMLCWSLPSGAQTMSSPPASTAGADIYRQVCQACHMPKGEGAQGPVARVPALANNSALAVATYPLTVVLNGRGAMPVFNGSLSPAQIAAVVTYVRTHFGNDFPAPVSVQDVQQLQKAIPSAER
jgi:mono/diheme cytochrome c family protein